MLHITPCRRNSSECLWFNLKSEHGFIIVSRCNCPRRPPLPLSLAPRSLVVVASIYSGCYYTGRREQLQCALCVCMWCPLALPHLTVCMLYVPRQGSSLCLFPIQKRRLFTSELNRDVSVGGLLKGD